MDGEYSYPSKYGTLDDGVLREGDTRSVGDDVLVETDN